MKNKNSLVLWLLLVVLGGIVLWGSPKDNIFGAPALLDENRNPRVFGSSCVTTNSIGVAGKGNTIGNVLATSTLRAWARISVGDNATNTIFLSFDEGAKAVADTGVPLNFANGTVGGEATSTPFVDFGLKTNLPYTGAVSATAETGTTTLLITECNYESF